MSSKGLFFALWLFAIVVGTQMDRWHESNFLPPPAEREQGDVLVDVFGEVKTVLARYLWFKMDLFHEVLDSQGVAPVKQAEVLPLLRIVTLLEPSLTDSYDQIVWDLYKGHGDSETAFELLEEGLRKNPRSFELTFRKALLQHMEEDYPEAMTTAASALRLTNERFTATDCLRLIYWSAREMKNIPVQKQALKDLLIFNPGDAFWLREQSRMENEGVEADSNG